MNITEKKMMQVLKEEYDKRLNHYINEKISVRSKSGDINYLENAEGLKVYDKAGFAYTVAGVVQKDNKEYIQLRYPDDERAGVKVTTPGTPLVEFDGEEFISNKKDGSREIISRKQKEVDFDVSDSSPEDYDPEELESGDEKPSVRVILIPVDQFMERFSV